MRIAILNYMKPGDNLGGPRGYLYNLLTGFESIGVKQPDVLYVLTDPLTNVSSSQKSKKKSFFLRPFLSIYKKGHLMKKKLGKKIAEYDCIHAQSIEDCYCLRHTLKYKGKIILTNHNPEPLFGERIGETKKGFKSFILRKLFNRVEAKAYKYANAYIFPSPMAMSIYNAFPGFKKYSRGKPVDFVITGAKKKEVSINSRFFREKYGLTSDDYLVSFIGRHNYIKGYDRLIDSFDIIKKEGCKVIVAGSKASEYSYPNDDDWKELGYITDAHNLIAASDLLVVPNRNTYFDLIIIEALSCGRIVLSSNTGGNIDISKTAEGLVLFDNNDNSDLARRIIEIKEYSDEKRKKLERSNSEYYVNHCTIEQFATNYNKALTSICDELFKQ